MADKDELEKLPEVEEVEGTEEQRAKRREKLETHSSSHHTAGTATSSDWNEDPARSLAGSESHNQNDVIQPFG